MWPHFYVFYAFLHLALLALLLSKITFCSQIYWILIRVVDVSNIKIRSKLSNIVFYFEHVIGNAEFLFPKNFSANPGLPGQLKARTWKFHCSVVTVGRGKTPESNGTYTLLTNNSHAGPRYTYKLVSRLSFEASITTLYMQTTIIHEPSDVLPARYRSNKRKWMRLPVSWALTMHVIWLRDAIVLI